MTHAVARFQSEARKSVRKSIPVAQYRKQRFELKMVAGCTTKTQQKNIYKTKHRRTVRNNFGAGPGYICLQPKRTKMGPTGGRRYGPFGGPWGPKAGVWGVLGWCVFRERSFAFCFVLYSMRRCRKSYFSLCRLGEPVCALEGFAALGTPRETYL